MTTGLTGSLRASSAHLAGRSVLKGQRKELVGSSQQVLELKPVDLGVLGSLSDCGVCEPASAENGVGKKSS